MAANKRLYYAIKQIGIRADSDASGNYDVADIVFGAQDISISTNYNLTQVFEIGQLEIYENFEELPDIEVAVSKVFDGKPLLWHMSTLDATSPTLAGRSNAKCRAAMSVFADTKDSATGTPVQIVECSGLFPKGINYNFSTDGAFTESLTLVGNDKVSKEDPRLLSGSDAAARAATMDGAGYFDGLFTGNNDTPNKIARKESLVFAYNATALDVNGSVAEEDATILPYEVDGISASGTNEVGSDGFKGAHIQSIAISTDLGRESLNELGTRGPYHRYATFPVEVTCAIEALSLSGDNGSATEGGIYTTGDACSGTASNLKDRTIRLAICGDGTNTGVRIYLGTKNRLSSVDFGGGTTDGGNDTNTYNYTNFNSMTVMDSADPHSSSATWWTNRTTYLLDV